ncbi:hypothetical protein [Sediminicurvatus halobius]|uniref:Mechanosensitive ion channel protein MscS n=1 Tax=Sediminicurvatus halobius TaxID=2182432 RepID=A0A2U2N6J6_9GAMM|nr:hypothetical protein [Spiribacter halobius]PWG64584.1 hypothetical protein DEM34_04450 [Spiribacter halobius]UEX79095.1 hypothetical protein LMH63_05475 [Spiribacter halobius]
MHVFPVRVTAILAVVLVMVLAPLLGVVLSGGDPGLYLRFPPRPLEAAEGSFVPLAFAAYALALLLIVGPFVRRVWRSSAPAPLAKRTFPIWGWAGVTLLVISWAVAWWPDPAWEGIRRQSFTPLWVGYIVAVNALTHARGGRALLVAEPGRFLALFPASALFWYLFEYLNQFTGNWIYGGVGETAADPVTWFLRSALPFSTVLPAVIGTRDLLATWPRLCAGLDNFWRPPVPPRRAGALGALAAAALGLVAVAVWPRGLYSMLWLAPPVLIVALQALAGERHIATPLVGGDWRGLWLAVLAALLCGFLWELWNVFSLARWTYHIPFVEGFHVFEMPLLGYAGYLPFGLTCIAAAQLLTGLDPRPRCANR